jgi:pilin isopeptide linkage protein
MNNFRSKGIWMAAMPIVLFFVMVLLLHSGQTVLADNTDACTLQTIPVEVKDRNGTIPANTTFTVHMRAGSLTPDAPLPTATDGSVKKEGTISFGPVTYTEPAVYYYRFTQDVGTASGVIYDTTVIELQVNVVKDPSNGGLRIASVEASTDGWKTKHDSIRFVNKAVKIRKARSDLHHIPRNGSGHQTRLLAPKTGDSSRIILWAGLLILSGTVLLGMLAVIHRARHRDESE